MSEDLGPENIANIYDDPGLKHVENMYEDLRIATKDAYEKADSLAMIREDLEVKSFGLRLAGKVVGKIEADREASLRDQLAQEFAALAIATRHHKRALMHLRLAELEVEQIRFVVRIAELGVAGEMAYKESDQT